MILRVFSFLIIFSLAIPQTSHANVCLKLFEAQKSRPFNDQLKERILESALINTKIKLTADQNYIRKVLKKWDLRESSPREVEVISQALVEKIDAKKSFLLWLKSLIFKKDPSKEAFRIRGETLVLTRELLDALEVRGYHPKVNSRFDRYLEFRKKHFNKIQLAKFLTINATLIHFLGFPLYFPKFDVVSNLDITSRDLDLIQTRGFESAYETILANYKTKLKLQNTIEYSPQAFFLGAITYISYNYFSFKVKESIEEIHYGVPVENVKADKLFLEWEKGFQERNGRKPDLKNQKDREDWEQLIRPLYRAWADTFNEQHGRFPDLSKDQDRLAWESFIASLE